MTSNYPCLTTPIDTTNEIIINVIGSAPVTQNLSLSGCNRVVYQGVTYTSSTIKRDTLRSTIGCDSVHIVATITVTTIVPITRDTSMSACNSTIVYQGITYSSSAIVRDTIRSVQGCDSVYRIANITITNITPLSAPSNLLPANNATGLNVPVNFSWGPVINALKYDLYLWKENDPVPTIPIVANITQINFAYGGPLLQYGIVYKWKVAAKHEVCQTHSAVQTFTMRKLPDLIVKNIQNPATAFSGQSITITWEVQDTGKGGTLNQQWLDLVYISKNALLEPAIDPFLGTVQNASELNPNQSYVQSATFTLPQGINDNYYVFIVANGYGQLLETDLSNNTKISVATTLINLTPPPDLQVTSLIAPNFTFSGQPVTITYKVSNLGTGPTVAANWTDFIYLTKDSVLNLATATFLGAQVHNGALAVNGFYTQQKTFTIADGTFGRYYFYVRTDISNQVYEHASENNNTGRSDSINILLTPPIDLVVTQITIKDSASNREISLVKWRTENAGGSSTETRNWSDQVFISKLPAFNPDSAIFMGSINRPSALDPGDGYNAQLNIIIPSNISGNYYVYVKTDAGNSIYEFSNENNNILRSTLPLKIISPDLVVSQLTVPAADSSGHAINISWVVKNNGSGDLFSGSITDRISVSTNATYVAGSVTEVGRINYNTGQLLKGDSLIKNMQIILPNGISGAYFVFIETDNTNNVFEGLNEGNNIRRSSLAIQVTLSPWPDLVVTSIQVPDSAFANEIIPFSFTGKNNGPGRIPNSTWTDRILLSKNPVFLSPDTIFLRGISQVRVLEKDSLYQVISTIKIPSNVPDSLRYYLYVYADGENNIYEHTAEGNNVQLKDSIFIKKYPPVDLAVTALSAPDSTFSGNPVSLQWTVENVGTVVTAISQWQDGLYLSADTIFNKNSDILVSEVNHTGVLSPASSYSRVDNFTIPNGISGVYYFLMVTDHNDLNHDVNKRNNYKLVGGNGDSIRINITLTPPPDLIVTSFTIPDQGTAGQPVKAKYTIKNNGPGITKPDSWTDRIFLSTDINLDLGDISIGSRLRTIALNPGASYSDSMDVTLPISGNGNYVVIIKTDASESVFEHLTENNNTSIGTINIIRPPLSDLIVTNIILPPGDAMAGDPITLQWNLKNAGLNPASGYMKEAIYFSEDTIKDVNDVLISSQDAYINLAPQAGILRNYTGDLTGVSLKQYYVLVHTDILNNIYESSDSNNLKASADRINVTVPELPINVLTQKNMIDKKAIYYRILIPDSLQGESLLVTLKGDSLNGSNELYLRYGEVPTRAIYDFSHSEPYKGN
ncbi:MAG: CARDB domain-containing protein, partial [Chitinophagaceae bacterium]